MTRTAKQQPLTATSMLDDVFSLLAGPHASRFYEPPSWGPASGFPPIRKRDDTALAMADKRDAA